MAAAGRGGVAQGEDAKAADEAVGEKRSLEGSGPDDREFKAPRQGDEDPAEDAAAALAAAKKRALEEAKRALLASLEASPVVEDKEEEAEQTEAQGGVEEKKKKSAETGEDDSDDDSESSEFVPPTLDNPVADLDIVAFLKGESESVQGTSIADTKARAGVLVTREAVYERREPKAGDPRSWALAIKKDDDEPAKPTLPPGARPANKASGHWAWGGGPGGVTFARPPPGKAYARPNLEQPSPAAALIPKAAPAAPSSPSGGLPPGMPPPPGMPLVSAAAAANGAAQPKTGPPPVLPQIRPGSQWQPGGQPAKPQFTPAPKLGSGNPRATLVSPPSWGNGWGKGGGKDWGKAGNGWGKGGCKGSW